MLENSWDRFASPSCRLYHREVGIHTFELLYFFSDSNRYERIKKVWQFLTQKCRRYTVGVSPYLIIQFLWIVSADPNTDNDKPNGDRQ